MDYSSTIMNMTAVAASAVFYAPENSSLRYDPAGSVITPNLESLWGTLRLHRRLLILLSLVLVPFVTYAVTYLQFQHARSTNRNNKSADLATPVAPYWLPFLGHLIPMGLDSASFVAGLAKRFGTEPVAIKLGSMRMTLFANPEQIQTVFKNSRMMSNKPVTSFVLENLLAASKKILAFYDADNSGMAAKARKGSTVKQEDRVYYFQIRTAHKYLSGQHLHALNERFQATLDRDLDALDVGTEWTEHDDLYRFLQLTVTRSSIETVFGAKLLELNPDFVEDFWEFEVNAPKFLHCLPRWLMPGAYRVREKLIESFKNWHVHAIAHYDCSRNGANDPEWEPNFGSRLIRTRQDGLLKMEPMDSEARASEDLGLMFGLNANVLPCIFWYVLESMRNPELHAKLLADVAACTSLESGKLDLQKLCNQPLTQSMHAEVLRLYIAIFTVRNAETGDVPVSQHRIRKDDMGLMYSRIGAMDDNAWRGAGRVLRTPLERFDAERFLVPIENATVACGAGLQNPSAPSSSATNRCQFSLDGLAGIWLPFGGGDRMCPGRHYAQAEMLATFALLFAKFDLELLSPDTSKVLPNMGFAPFGSLPPTRKLPFRFRRKQPVMS